MRGPYLPFRTLRIMGWNRLSVSGNLYFTSVNQHPIEPEMLIATFPINKGNEFSPNSDGESAIAMALSCDGVNWNALTILVWSWPINEGRT